MFGMHDKDGEVKATIGQGEVTVEKNPEELEKANRELHGIQNMITNIDIDIIKLYYAEKNEQAYEKAIKEMTETGIVGFFQDAAKATVAVSQEMFNMLTPQPDDEVFISLDKLEADSDVVKADKTTTPHKEPEENTKDKQYQKERVYKLIDKLIEQVGERAFSQIPQDIDKQIKYLANLREYQYQVDGDRVQIKLENTGIVPVGIASGISLSFELAPETMQTMAKLGKNALRIGKHVVKVNPYVTAALLAYDVGTYMYNNNAYVKGLVDRGVKNVKEFIDETLEEVGLHISQDGEVFEKSKASNNNKNNAKINSTPNTKGTPDPDWEPDDEGDPRKNKKWKEWTKREDGSWHHPEGKDFEGIANRPNAQNSKLQKVYKEVWRDTDKIPGGSAQILREEAASGDINPQHLLKVKERITQLKKIINKANEGKVSLSRIDRETADRVLHDLKDALNKARSMRK